MDWLLWVDLFLKLLFRPVHTFVHSQSSSPPPLNTQIALQPLLLTAKMTVNGTANGVNGDYKSSEFTENRSVVWVAPEKVELQHRPVPEVKEDEVLVEVIVTGICGSDAHVWASNPAKPPPVLGHESAGKILKVGSKVTDREVGQRVAVEPGNPCMK